jgi:hypothetical protein
MATQERTNPLMVYRPRNIIRVGSYSGKNTKRKGAGESTEKESNKFRRSCDIFRENLPIKLHIDNRTYVCCKIPTSFGKKPYYAEMDKNSTKPVFKILMHRILKLKRTP